MSQVILFHHVQGRTAGIEAFADELRTAGHDVTVPDFFDGTTFDSIDAGLAHAEKLGFESIFDQGTRFAEGLAEGLVYAGFSMGSMIAHKLAQTRPGALGALLYHHGDVSIDTFGESWPEGVDLQIHVSKGDPFYDPDIAQEFVDKAGTNTNAELFLYPGSSHLFTDSSLAEYDPNSAALVMQRTLHFLDGRGRG